MRRGREGERGREREGEGRREEGGERVKGCQSEQQFWLTCNVMSGVLQNVNVVDVDIEHWITVCVQVSLQNMSCQ